MTFHYNGHQLLTGVTLNAREILAKYRINPGNVGFGRKRDEQFATIVERAMRARQAGAHRRELGQPGRQPDGRA